MNVEKELLGLARELTASSRLLLPFDNAEVKVSRRRAAIVVAVTEYYSAPPMVAPDVDYADKRMERSMNKMMDLMEKAYKDRVKEMRFSPNPYTHLSAGSGKIGFMREVTIMVKKDDHDALMELADELES